MSVLPQTLEETIKMVQRELRLLIPENPEEKQEQEATRSLPGATLRLFRVQSGVCPMVLRATGTHNPDMEFLFRQIEWGQLAGLVTDQRSSSGS